MPSPAGHSSAIGRLARRWAGLLAVLSAAGVCVHAADDPRYIVSPRLLEHAGLKMSWQTKLPMNKGETIRQLTIIGERLYVLSDQNFMFCLDRHKGGIVFSKPLAPAGFTVLGLNAGGEYGGELMLLIGNKLVRMEKESGRQIGSADFDFAVVCAPVRNSKFLYLGGVDRRLHVLQADNKVQVFEVAAANESVITTIVAEEGLVVFGTEAGSIIAITPDKPRKLWQFDVGAGIAGPIIKDGASVFFAGANTNVYRLDIVGATTVKLAWKCPVGGIVDQPPAVTKAVVYQYGVGRGLTAIDRQRGATLWSLPEGLSVAAESGGKAYVITKNRTLTVVDNTGGRTKYSVNFAAVSKCAVNVTDSRMYVADDRGRIACIEPAQ